MHFIHQGRDLLDLIDVDPGAVFERRCPLFEKGGIGAQGEKKLGLEQIDFEIKLDLVSNERTFSRVPRSKQQKRAFWKTEKPLNYKHLDILSCVVEKWHRNLYRGGDFDDPFLWGRGKSEEPCVSCSG